MTGLRPGDVVTDEPIGVPGLVLRDGDGDLIDWRDGRWRRCSRPMEWRRISGYPPITVVAVPPELGPVPTEQWETVTADQVRVGDHIEVTQEWDHHSASAVHRCLVYAITPPDEGRRCKVQLSPDEPDDYLWIGLWVQGKTETIRRRVRTPMPEPDAPAVVKHAGRIWVRMEMREPDNQIGGKRDWWPLSLGDGDNRSEWLPWPEVLALDPATDPVLVDLGGGE